MRKFLLLYATTLIHINQYNTGKQILEKKIGEVYKKMPHVSGLVTTTVLIRKIKKVENKFSQENKLWH